MSEMAPEYRLAACRWNGRNKPRTVPGRHDGYCQDDACPGCAECPRGHCRICLVQHCAGTCEECAAETREALHEIARMCGALPEEVESRGVEGEAMFLLSPVADPEAIGHMEASVKVGRVPQDYLADPTGDLHPAWVLGKWNMQWRDALEHGEEPFTISAAVDYLDANLPYMAGYEHLPFEEFASDVSDCRNHMEGVLHDGEQRETGAPCMRCGKSLQKCWEGRELPWSKSERPALAREDGWACPGCKQWHNEDQYRLAVKAQHLDEAEWLTAADIQVKTGVKVGTLRVWATRRFVARRRDSGRTVYLVADVKARIVEEQVG